LSVNIMFQKKKIKFSNRIFYFFEILVLTFPKIRV
jgi:hypothetical protein